MYALSAVRPSLRDQPQSDAARQRAGLALVMAASLAVRLWVVGTHTYIVQPDETLQYLEPAHRLAFGSGVVTWEFLDGIRSWFLPGILAAVMRVVSLVAADPHAYVTVIRVLCVLASLSVPYVGFRLAARHGGEASALIVGLMCAFASDLVYFAPVIMTEPLATDAALLAIWLGDSARDHGGSRRRLLLAGVMFGLAATLRYQYAPILGVAALWQYAGRRADLATVVAGGLAVVVPGLGLLDALTWGTPFQSVWLNYLRNAIEGVSGAMGSEPWYFYLAYYYTAWGAAAWVLLVCAACGAVRVPTVAVVAVCTIGLHALAAHKELRFVVLATACMPILIGSGLGGLLGRVPALARRRVGVPVAVALALAVSATMAAGTYRRATAADAWHRDRSMLAATEFARGVANACGLGVRTMWVYRSGGYSYWHRNVPIYFETWDAAQILEHSDFRLRLDSTLGGEPVPQYPGPALAANAVRFNVMIGTPDDGLPGFSRQACFGEGSADDRTWCVFTRPGGCTPAGS